jgi:hypothetical protein
MTPVKTGVLFGSSFLKESWVFVLILVFKKKLLACCSLGVAGLSAVLQSAKPMYNSSQQTFSNSVSFF